MKGEEIMTNDYEDLFIANMLVNDGSLVKEDKYVRIATYLVKEVCTKDLRITGYKEAITDELIINRQKRKYALRHGYTELDVDNVKPFRDEPGDILWRVSRFPATKVLTNEEIENYLKADPEMIKYSINFHRENAKNHIDDKSSNILSLKWQ